MSFSILALSASVLFSSLSFHVYSQPYNFDGIVKLSNCSGSIIKFENQSDDKNALVLTNGHCISLPVAMSGFQSIVSKKESILANSTKEYFTFSRMLEPGEIIFNKLHSRKMDVFNSSMKLVPIETKKILYATMTDTDIAIYEINETYNDLLKQGVTTHILAKQKPKKSSPIQIISGYWEKGYQCLIEDFVYLLKEGQWTFQDSIRYSSNGCETIGGTSGSPILEKNKRIVVGINNTSNNRGQDCSINNPCEVDINGNVSVLAKRSYGQQTYTLYSCLTSQGKIDLTIPGCVLPKGLEK